MKVVAYFMLIAGVLILYLTITGKTLTQLIQKAAPAGGTS
jgi:amino acid permease